MEWGLVGDCQPLQNSWCCPPRLHLPKLRDRGDIRGGSSNSVARLCPLYRISQEARTVPNPCIQQQSQVI